MSRRTVLVLVLALTLAACDVPLRADQLLLRGQEDAVELVRPETALRGGETVITIENFANAERQFVLARTDLRAEAVPVELATARTPSDNDAVVAVTEVMDPVDRDFAGLLALDVPSVTRLHVHLVPGERYLLFDRLGGLDEGLWIELLAKA